MFKLIVFKLFVFLSIAFLSPSSNASLTPGYSCDTCSYESAVELAKTLLPPPRCTAKNLDGGLFSIGTTSFICNKSSVELIIANPLSRSAFKFRVQHDQIDPAFPAYSTTVTDLDMTEIEFDAASEFYEIDSQFRDAVQLAMREYLPPGFANKQVSTSLNSDSSPNCKQHPGHLLTDDVDFEKELRKDMTQEITDRIGDESWKEFTTERSLGSGLKISRDGTGIEFSLVRNSIDVYAVREFDFGSNENALSYTVTYTGEAKGPVIKGLFGEFRGYERRLKLAFALNEGSSLIEGISISRWKKRDIRTSGGFSECFSEILENNADDIVEVEVEVPDAGGAGNIDFTNGIVIKRGGTLTGRSTIVNGCRIRETRGYYYVNGDDRRQISVTYYKECN